jgi:hypothetical protein
MPSIAQRALALIGCCGLVAATACTTELPKSTSAPPQATSQPATTSQADLPVYQPSAVLSRTDVGSARTDVLLSGDSVEKVSSFYRDALDQGGWTTVSATGTLPWSTNLRAQRDKQGATIQISSTGSGSSISVTTYPI